MDFQGIACRPSLGDKITSTILSLLFSSISFFLFSCPLLTSLYIKSAVSFRIEENSLRVSSRDEPTNEINYNGITKRMVVIRLILSLMPVELNTNSCNLPYVSLYLTRSHSLKSFKRVTKKVVQKKG